jgi:hypothetical protein
MSFSVPPLGGASSQGSDISPTFPTDSFLTLNNVTINTSGTVIGPQYYVGSVNEIDVFCVVVSQSGSGSIKFGLNILEQTTNQIMTTYTSGVLSSTGATSIFVSSFSVALGDTVSLSYTANGASFSFGVYERLITKRW